MSSPLVLQGVRVIEVKHWTDRHRSHGRVGSGSAEHEGSAGRHQTTKGLFRGYAYVDSAVLITEPPSKAARILGQGKIRGVPFCSLAKDWQEALGLERRQSL